MGVKCFEGRDHLFRKLVTAHIDHTKAVDRYLLSAFNELTACSPVLRALFNYSKCNEDSTLFISTSQKGNRFREVK